MRTHGRLPNPPGANDGKGMDTKIYLDAESAEKLRELSYQTRLPMAEITRRIMNEALSRVRLIPATVYDFEIK